MYVMSQLFFICVYFGYDLITDKQGRNHVFKVWVQFLGLGYYYPSTEKN